MSAPCAECERLRCVIDDLQRQMKEERERHRKELNEEIREARRDISEAYTEGRWSARDDDGY